MSRSFRKTPIVKENVKRGKNFANRRVRRSKDVPNGKAYRKFYNTWDICDWKIHWSKQSYIRRWEHRNDEHQRWNTRLIEKSFHDHMRYWYSVYYWK